jgi:hypothetical protein
MKKYTITIIIFTIAVWACFVASTVRAGERKESSCYQGDYVVNSQASADELQHIFCIDGNLLWALGFDENGHRIVTVHVPALVEVSGWIIIVGPFIQILDFPHLRHADVIDGSLSGMLQCVEIMRLAYQSDATMDPICRGGYLP